MYHWTRKSPLYFGSHPDQMIRLGGGMLSPSTLVIQSKMAKFCVCHVAPWSGTGLLFSTCQLCPAAFSAVFTAPIHEGRPGWVDLSTNRAYLFSRFHFETKKHRPIWNLKQIRRATTNGQWKVLTEYGYVQSFLRKLGYKIAPPPDKLDLALSDWYPGTLWVRGDGFVQR